MVFFVHTMEFLTLNVPFVVNFCPVSCLALFIYQCCNFFLGLRIKLMKQRRSTSQSRSRYLKYMYFNFYLNQLHINLVILIYHILYSSDIQLSHYMAGQMICNFVNIYKC